MADSIISEVNYDSQKKVFFVKVDDIMFVVPSPFQQADQHPLSGIVSSGVFQKTGAVYWETGVAVDGNSRLRARPALRGEMQEAIGECMNRYARGKFANLQLNDGAPADVRCLLINPPTFEFHAGDLVAEVSFYEVERILVKTAARNNKIDDPMPLAKMIVGANTRRIFDACARLWILDLGLPRTSIVAV